MKVQEEAKPLNCILQPKGFEDWMAFCLPEERSQSIIRQEEMPVPLGPPTITRRNPRGMMSYRSEKAPGILIGSPVMSTEAGDVKCETALRD